MTFDVAFQMAVAGADVPPEETMRQWLMSAPLPEAAAFTVRIVDEVEIAQLNAQFRGKAAPTNVLAFPYESPAALHEAEDANYLGDIAIAASVVQREAGSQGKTNQAHWAHILLHGVLHLLGYDHQTDDEANTMEALETRLMIELGFPAPYEHDHQHHND